MGAALPLLQASDLLHLALGCHVAISAPLPDSELLEAGSVAPGPQWPLWSKPKDGVFHLCGAIPPGLLPWSAVHVLSVGRRDPVLGSKGPLCPMYRSFGFCSQWEFLLMLFLWLVAQGRGSCWAGVGVPAGVAPNTRGLATIIRVRTVQRAMCSKNTLFKVS